MRFRLLTLMLVSAVRGQTAKLPLKVYTAADGLAHNSVNRIVRDSHGYLWFCTSEGLSRFDGYEFHNYGRRDGLPHRDVHDLLETRSGDFWIATSGGLCRYQPKLSGRRKFRVYRVEGNDRASYMNVLLEDAQGRIWCGTDAGLLRLERSAAPGEYVLRGMDLGIATEGWDDRVVSAVMQDAQGDIWVGSGSGVIRWRAEGRLERYTIHDGLPNDFVTALLCDKQHRIWVATNKGICRLSADPATGRRAVETAFRAKEGLGSETVRALHEAADGTIFAGTNAGLSIAQTDAATGSQIFSNYSISQGLPRPEITTVAEDVAGSLWIGTDGGGAAKLTWKTFLTYTADDGLAGDKFDSMLYSKAGSLCIIARAGDTGLFVNEFDGRRFHPTRVNLPPGTQLLNWGARSQCVVSGRDGNWWVATSDGLFRFSGVTSVRALGRLTGARYTAWHGLPAGPVLAVFEDTRGDIWVSTTGRENGLARWDSRAQTFRLYSKADGLAWLPTSGISLFAADASGDLWMGLLRFGRGQSEMARLCGLTFQRFGGGEDRPAGGVRAVYLDSRNRLWVGTNQTGVMRFDDPDADRPMFTRYTTANGLSSDVILSLTEDTEGRIYAGNGSGVDRLDTTTNQVKRYTSADGLAPGEVRAAFRDRDGFLWFGTSGGLSRLQSPPIHPPAPPPIAITSLRVGGVPQPASELGETEISGLRYLPDQNDIEVGFASLAFAPGETLRYQYRLEGVDAEWSPPSLQRSVNYPNLAPDSYLFLVRAINSDGIASSRPASIAFIILPPIWLRWWFQLLAAAAAGATIYWLHRFRVARLLELERVRTRIATDLHDDIGSSLSQIAILSEVANRYVDRTQPQLAGPLADIAGISREIVDSMSDIVWAVDPERDHLGDLVHRMRRFASDVFSPRGIQLGFQAPAEEQDLQMGADLRRQIFLIFKEAVHNVVRHSGATAVAIAFRVEHGWLRLTVTDNGRGFDFARDCGGHGLRSMRERAEQVGGAFEVNSSLEGTTVTLRAPVRGGWLHK